MRVYYNEINPECVAWLNALIASGHLPSGDIDERPIQEVQADDVRGYQQCHFFAGIGVWPYALGVAGWGEKKVWTGSCPCQPFSSAGQHGGTDDDRHLWPSWMRLIAECQPDTVFGEQVATKNGRAWFDIVSTDLERQAYAVGAAVTNACSFGAPHTRQRLYFVASMGYADKGGPVELPRGSRRKTRDSGKTDQGLADPAVQRLEGSEFHGPDGFGQQSGHRSLGYSNGNRCGKAAGVVHPQTAWSDHVFIPTRDEKAQRPIKPGLYPLAYGTPGSLGRVRGYGNALCAPQAQGFIEAFMSL